MSSMADRDAHLVMAASRGAKRKRPTLTHSPALRLVRFRGRPCVQHRQGHRVPVRPSTPNVCSPGKIYMMNIPYTK